MQKKLLASTLVVLLFSACGSKSEVTGRYQLDQSQFAEALADKLIESGKVPDDARSLAVNQLKNARFDLELLADGSFTATQSVMKERRSYRGTWTLVGKQFRLDQTHENGKEVTDELVGTLVDGKMDLTHQDENVGEFRFVLHRETAATPPR